MFGDPSFEVRNPPVDERGIEVVGLQRLLVQAEVTPHQAEEPRGSTYAEVSAKDSDTKYIGTQHNNES
jgi:hypothetical protein